MIKKGETIEISSGRGLKKIEKYPEAHFVLTDDIRFEKRMSFWEFIRPGFTKDYTNSVGFGFIEELEGTLDGNGHTIYDFELSPYSHSRAAIIKKNKGTIKNLNVEGVDISKASFAGGLVVVNEGEIKNCNVQGKVRQRHSNENVWTAGGICAENNGGKIINCTFEGRVGSSEECGGITGENNGDILECEFIGSVKSGRYTGGIAGMNFGQIEESHSYGQVFGTEGASVGGIAGTHRGDSICLCSSDSEIISSTDPAGGLVGENEAELISSYFYGDISSRRDKKDLGILTGFNEGVIKNCYWSPCKELSDIEPYVNTREGTVSNVGEKEIPEEDLEDFMIANRL